MKKFLFLSIVLFACISLYAEISGLTISPDSVYFTSCTVGQSYEFNITFSNSTENDIIISYHNSNEDIYFESQQLTVPSGGSLDADLQFECTDNILVKDIIVFHDNNQNQSAGFPVQARCNIPITLYSGTYNLYDEELKDELFSLINNHTSLGYTDAKEEMFGYIDNENGQVMGVYTGNWYSIPVGTMPNQDIFNCEHTWPQSMGAEGIAKSDLHHLFPTYNQVNSTRGNLPFGIVTNPNWQQGGSKRGTNASGMQVFEPRDPHKGDCARAMFYFCLRYSNPENFLNQQETVLRQWHNQDIVSQKEIDRNNEIDDLQDNRNPFVDNPGFMDRIYRLSNNSPRPTSPDPYLSPSTITFSDVPEGQISERTLLITNYGNDELEIEDAFFENDVFGVVSAPSQIEQNEYSEIYISFDGSEGTFTANLILDTNAGNLSIPVSGNSINAINDSKSISLNTTSQLKCYPNPFNPVINIYFDGIDNTQSTTEINIYNSKGNLVKSFYSPMISDGMITWDGTDKSGKAVASGIYLVTARSGNLCLAKKISLIK